MPGGKNGILLKMPHWKKEDSILLLLRLMACGHHIPRTMDTWWLNPKFPTAQNHIPNPNRKFCKMYENLSFLQKKWLGSAKSRDTQWQNSQKSSTSWNLPILTYHIFPARLCQISIIQGFCPNYQHKNLTWVQNTRTTTTRIVL